MLAAMHLAGMTTVAHAQANDDPNGKGARQAPTEGQVGESWRHRKAASQEQAAADATLGRVLAREHLSIPNQTPAHVPAPAPPQPTGQPGWLLAALVALAAVLAVVAGLALVAARRHPPGSGRAGDLTAVTVALDGAAAPTRQPHHPASSHGIARRCGDPVTTST